MGIRTVDWRVVITETYEEEHFGSKKECIVFIKKVAHTLGQDVTAEVVQVKETVEEWWATYQDDKAGLVR